MKATILATTYKEAMSIWRESFPEYKFGKIREEKGCVRLVVVCQ